MMSLCRVYFRKLRAEREAQRQSRIRLGQRLEALRPLTSTNSKQPSAEATPTLFSIVSVNSNAVISISA